MRRPPPFGWGWCETALWLAVVATLVATMALTGCRDSRTIVAPRGDTVRTQADEPTYEPLVVPPRPQRPATRPIRIYWIFRNDVTADQKSYLSAGIRWSSILRVDADRPYLTPFGTLPYGYDLLVVVSGLHDVCGLFDDDGCTREGDEATYFIFQKDDAEAGAAERLVGRVVGEWFGVYGFTVTEKFDR